MCLMPHCPDCQQGLIREYNLEKKIEELEQQLATTQAALRASTKLLQAYWDVCRIPAFASQIDINKQLAANEAALGGG